MIKQYLREIIIVGLTLLLLSAVTCSHNSQKVAEGEKKQLEEQLKKEVNGVKVFREQQKILFDSISFAEKLKDKKIAELHNSNEKLNEQVKIRQKSLEEKKKELVGKSFEQLAQVFRELGYEDTRSTPTSVNLEKDAPISVLEDLTEGINCFEDLRDKNEIIANKDEEIKVVNEKVVDVNLKFMSKSEEVDKLNSFAKTQEEIIKKDNKIIKRLKTKNFITTYIVPPFTFFTGVYLGNKLAK